MKIVQDPESGEIKFQLDGNEKYYIEEQLDTLMKFVCEQAVKTHQLTKLYEEIAKQRLDGCGKTE
jgi:hypothetical protein